MATGYCLKCKASRELANPVHTMSTRRRKPFPVTRGTCPVCHATLTALGHR